MFSIFAILHVVNVCASGETSPGGGKAYTLVSTLPDGSLQLHDPDILLEIAPGSEEVAVVSVVGPWRTGKSYLLNQIINCESEDEYFKVGHDTVPETEGLTIKLYKTKEPNGGSKRIIFLDSAGLQCPYRSEQGDARVMALASLLSSILIYNHPGALNDYEIKRFKFIVGLSHAVPSTVDGEYGIDKDLQEFRPDLFWVMRDTFLRLTDKDHNDVTPTQLVELNLAHNAKGVERFFRSITGFAMPYPMENMNRVRELQDNPSLRSEDWKIAVKNLREHIFKQARAKQLKADMPRMRGKDIRDLLVTFVRRLNSDSGIGELDTMKSLIDSLHGQKLSEAFNTYNATLTSTPLPMSQANLQKLHLDAVAEAEAALKTSLESYPDEELEENLATLQDKLKNQFEQRNKTNTIAIMDFAKVVDEEEVNVYLENWNNFQMPAEEEDMLAWHQSIEKKSLSAVGERLGGMLDVESLGKQQTRMSGMLKNEFDKKKRENQNTAIQVCKALKDTWERDFDDRILKYYWIMEDLVDDLKRYEADFKVKCKGPAKNMQELEVDAGPIITKLEEELDKRKLAYSHTFFAFVVFMTSFTGLWVVDLLDNHPYYFIMSLSIFLWTVTFISNQLVQSLGPLWYAKAIWNHVSDFFLSALSFVGFFIQLMVEASRIFVGLAYGHLDLMIGIISAIMLLSCCYLFYSWYERKFK